MSKELDTLSLIGFLRVVETLPKGKGIAVPFNVMQRFASWDLPYEETATEEETKKFASEMVLLFGVDVWFGKKTRHFGIARE